MSQRSIDEGEIFVTDAGNLPAKYVVHVNSPVWKGGGEEESKVLSETVMKSLLQASEKNAMSISIPAISCGISGFVSAGLIPVLFKFLHDVYYSLLVLTLV